MTWLPFDLEQFSPGCVITSECVLGEMASAKCNLTNDSKGLEEIRKGGEVQRGNPVNILPSNDSGPALGNWMSNPP